MEIQAVVFDFGNVVGYFDHRRTTERLVPYSALAGDLLHRQLFGGDLEMAYDLGRISTDEFLLQARDCGQLSCSAEVLSAAWADIFWPNADIVALLPKLTSRVRLLLGSNTNELHCRQFRRQFADALKHF